MQHVIPLKIDLSLTPNKLLEQWRTSLQEQDHSSGTVKKYTQAVAHFFAWFEQEEHAPLQLATLTPIALIGYRNELQHEQHKSISTINLRISALRAWCAWLVDQGYLPLDPAARVKLIGGETVSKREGLSGPQVNALLRQAQISRDPARNYAIVQVLLQTEIRLSECSGLTFGDITIGPRSGLLLVRAGKGNKVRSVPLNASAREALATAVVSRLGGVRKHQFPFHQGGIHPACWGVTFPDASSASASPARSGVPIEKRGWNMLTTRNIGRTTQRNKKRTNGGGFPSEVPPVMPGL